MEKKQTSLKIKASRIKDIMKQHGNVCIAIKGKWGIGKTYFWKECIEKDSDKEVVYISLFGKEHYSQIIEEIVLKTAKHYNKRARTASSIISKLTHIFSNGIINIKPESIFAILKKGDFNNIIICFDDIERKSDLFSMKDFIGLVANLKEDKCCKVVIILNTDKLKDNEVDENRNNTDLKLFEMYEEKCVDYHFEITENSEIARMIINNGVSKYIDIDSDEKCILSKVIFEVFSEKCDSNLRTLFRLIDDVEYIYKQCKLSQFYSQCSTIFKLSLQNILSIIVYARNNKNNNQSIFKNYIDNNILDDDDNINKIKEEFQKIMQKTFIEEIKELNRKIVLSNTDDNTLIDEIDRIMNMDVEKLSFMKTLDTLSFDECKDIFAVYKEKKGRNLLSETYIRKMFIEQFLKNKLYNKYIRENESDTTQLNITDIVDGNEDVKNYYIKQDSIAVVERIEQMLNEEISNNCNMQKLFYDDVKYFDNVSIDYVLYKFKTNNEFYNEFVRLFVTSEFTMKDFNNNLFKGFKKFINQNECKKKYINDNIKNDELKQYINARN